jgi:hypothetical protein
MEMCYNGALAMPSSYAVMNDDEMIYVEGGKTISYRLAYASTGGAMIKSVSYILSNKWYKISAYDLAAEIFFTLMHIIMLRHY